MGKQLGPGASGDPDNPGRRPAPEPAYEVQPTPTTPAGLPEEPEPKAPPGSGYPRPRGGGWFETSDGAVHRGEEEAEEAERRLRGMSREELNERLAINPSEEDDL